MNHPQSNSFPSPRIIQETPGLIDLSLAKAEKAGTVRVLRMDNLKPSTLRGNLERNYAKYPELKEGLDSLSTSVIAEIKNRIECCLDLLESKNNVVSIKRSAGEKLALRLKKSASTSEINEAKKELLLMQYYFQLLLSQFFNN